MQAGINHMNPGVMALRKKNQYLQVWDKMAAKCTQPMNTVISTHFCRYEVEPVEA